MKVFTGPKIPLKLMHTKSTTEEELLLSSTKENDLINHLLLRVKIVSFFSIFMEMLPTRVKFIQEERIKIEN